MPSPVRVGFIGAGQLFQEIYLPTFSHFPEVELLALCDISEAALAASLKRFGIRETTSRFEDIVAMSEVDAVILTVPNHLHARIAQKALRAGKHVLSEKPVALNSEEGQTLRRAVGETGQVYMVALPYRFDVESRMLRQWMREGRLGDVHHVRAGLVRRNHCPRGWFTDQSRSGGGALLHLGAHLVDLALWLLDFPTVERVSASCYGRDGALKPSQAGSGSSLATGLPQMDVHDVEDYGTVTLRLEGGRSVSIETGWQAHCEDDRQYLDVDGSVAGATLWPLRRFEESGGVPTDVRPRYTAIDHHQALVRHFVDCILARESPIECPLVGNIEDGLRLLHLMHCIYESARSGCEVDATILRTSPAQTGGMR